MVVPYTKLSKMIEKDPSIYSPYTDDQLLQILLKANETVPEYCRVIRMLRDFPSELILQGSKTLNLRQIVEKENNKCRCIRCREIKGDNFMLENVETKVLKYNTINGEEYFISQEDIAHDKIIGLVRLRLPKKSLKFIPELKDAALIRELHVYGQQKTLKLNNSLKSKTQHKGFGKQLMSKAEEIAKNNNFNKIAVISAIGTREYYAKLGYKLEGTYMIKYL